MTVLHASAKHRTSAALADHVQAFGTGNASVVSPTRLAVLLKGASGVCVGTNHAVKSTC